MPITVSSSALNTQSPSKLILPQDQMLDPLYDPIIQKILSQRTYMDDVSSDDELERQRRMLPMLRHSRKYKKLQVSDANQKWGLSKFSELDAFLGEVCEAADLDPTLMMQKGSDSFSSTDSGVDLSNRESTASLPETLPRKEKRVSFSDHVHFIQKEPVSKTRSFRKLFRELILKACKSVH